MGGAKKAVSKVAGGAKKLAGGIAKKGLGAAANASPAGKITQAALQLGKKDKKALLATLASSLNGAKGA